MKTLKKHIGVALIIAVLVGFAVLSLSGLFASPGQSPDVAVLWRNSVSPAEELAVLWRNSVSPAEEVAVLWRNSVSPETDVAVLWRNALPEV